MNLHIDPELDILRARRRRVPQNSPVQRDRLDAAASKLFVEIVAAGADRNRFYITIGAGELHLYAPREIMQRAQEHQLRCDFIVDWHELKRDIVDARPHASQRLRSEPAPGSFPQEGAASHLSTAEVIA